METSPDFSGFSKTYQQKSRRSPDISRKLNSLHKMVVVDDVRCDHILVQSYPSKCIHVHVYLKVLVIEHQALAISDLPLGPNFHLGMNNFPFLAGSRSLHSKLFCGKTAFES